MDAKTQKLIKALEELATNLGWTIEDIDEYSDNEYPQSVIITFEKVDDDE